MKTVILSIIVGTAAAPAGKRDVAFAALSLALPGFFKPGSIRNYIQDPHSVKFPG